MKIFNAVVVSHLVSGLASMVLSAKAYNKLATAYYKMLRKILGGKAIKKKLMEDGTIKHEALSNNAVCQALQTVSFTTLLRTRRLKFLQSIVAEPQVHELYLACLCGQYEMDIQT